MQVDVAIIDITTPVPYDSTTLDNAPLGGTEAQVIYLTEALAKEGYTVAVLQHNQKYELSGKHQSYYLPLSYINTIKPLNVISVCSTAGFDLFPDAKKFSWQTNYWTEGKHEKTIEVLERHNATVIALTDWHKQNILNVAPQLKVERIFLMIPDKLYMPEPASYNKNRLCWLASPHKGLNLGLEYFQELRKTLPEVELHVFNPGYFTQRVVPGNAVVNHGAKARPYVWNILRSSLCLYYPSSFAETFGCIAAESNALRVPVASLRNAGLIETTANSLATTLEDVNKQVIEWYNGADRSVAGQERFKLSRILEEWKRILS